MFSLTQEILQHLQFFNIREVSQKVHDFGNDRGEIMEIEILPTTKFSDKKISDLTMPKGVVIGGL